MELQFAISTISKYYFRMQTILLKYLTKIDTSLTCFVDGFIRRLFHERQINNYAFFNMLPFIFVVLTVRQSVRFFSLLIYGSSLTTRMLASLHC